MTVTFSKNKLLKIIQQLLPYLEQAVEESRFNAPIDQYIREERLLKDVRELIST